MSTAKKPAATTTTKPAASTSSSKPAQNPPATGTTTAPSAEKPATTGAAKTTPAADVPTVPDSRDPIEAKMPMVKKFYDADAALFVDAREAVEYAEGHIAGAVSLPFEEAFKDPKKLTAIDAKGKPIIVYCGGGDCEASKNLAYSLIDAGRKKVVVFTDGYPAWTGAGYPTAKGAEPGATK
jgi:rhodanese-related sulfurtransferase